MTNACGTILRQEAGAIESAGRCTPWAPQASAQDLRVRVNADGIIEVTNPITGRQAIRGEYVESVLSVMGSCGMYDYAGEWLYRVGMPAKSGVSGGVIAVLPGQGEVSRMRRRVFIAGPGANLIIVMVVRKRWFALAPIFAALRE
jgi:hypothetical protein